MTSEELNQKCFQCAEAFEKDGIPFSTSMCKFCMTGFEIHQELIKESEAEQKWGAIDWTSSKWKDYYKG